MVVTDSAGARRTGRLGGWAARWLGGWPLEGKAGREQAEAGSGLAPFRPPTGKPYLRPVHCQRLVLVGDAHLGRGSSHAERAFLAFLDTVPRLGDGLVVTGDLFEFWFAYRRVVPRHGARVMGALAHLRRTMPVLLAGGNHDRWGGGFWREQLDIEFAPAEGRFSLNGHAGLVTHGDGLTETHWSARVLHQILRHDATIALYRSVHPDLGLWLVDHLSGWLGDRERTPQEIAAAAARQEAWARARLAAEPSLCLLAMGHTHSPTVVEVEPGRLYVNPGAWFDGFRYAVVSDGMATLARFSS
jgi:UDP-2,3-diacylglucosamine hydrolase